MGEGSSNQLGEYAVKEPPLVPLRETFAGAASASINDGPTWHYDFLGYGQLPGRIDITSPGENDEMQFLHMENGKNKSYRVSYYNEAVGGNVEVDLYSFEKVSGISTAYLQMNGSITAALTGDGQVYVNNVLLDENNYQEYLPYFDDANTIFETALDDLQSEQGIAPDARVTLKTQDYRQFLKFRVDDIVFPALKEEIELEKEKDRAAPKIAPQKNVLHPGPAGEGGDGNKPPKF